MIKNRSRRGLAALCALVLTAAACGGDDDDGESSADATTTPADDATATTSGDTAAETTEGTTEETTEETSEETTEATTDETTGGADGAAPAELWDNGECDSALDPYPVGIITTFESPILSLGDQVTALEASIEAFNARGGIGGHCMEMTFCDAEADPNKEVDCGRQFVDGGIVATLNDTVFMNPQGVIDVTLPAGLPRVGISPNTGDLAGTAINNYAFSVGGAGTTFVMAPACTKAGFTKIGMINVDSPQIDLLLPPVEGMLAAYGAELVGNVPVPGGTTDFQQFILNMEDAGAECVMLPLGENEIVQVLQAAEQLGTEMMFSTSSGSLGLEAIRGVGDVGGQLILNGSLPPATAPVEEFPLLEPMIADLSASGDPQLQAETLKESPMRSWVATYALVRIIEDFGDPDDISREAITAAMDAATDVEIGNLIPPWTPNLSVAGADSPFGRISNPWAYISTYDPAADNVVVEPDLVNMLAELGGQTEYPQPE